MLSTHSTTKPDPQPASAGTPRTKDGPVGSQVYKYMLCEYMYLWIKEMLTGKYYFYLIIFYWFHNTIKYKIWFYKQIPRHWAIFTFQSIPEMKYPSEI